MILFIHSTLFYKIHIIIIYVYSNIHLKNLLNLLNIVEILYIVCI